MTIAFQLAVFALIATSSILLISVPVVFASLRNHPNLQILLKMDGGYFMLMEHPRSLEPK